MNCQETPECHCCEVCIQSQNERFRRNSYHQVYEKPSSPPNWRNENCCEGYPRAERRPREHRKPSPHRGNNCDQSQWVDANTLRTLSSLREKACKFLETSDGTRSPDEDECRPYTRVKESHPCDGSVKKKAQDIDYEPVSNFLRKMKQKNDKRMNEPDTCPPAACDCESYPCERQSHMAEESHFNCVRSGSDYSPQLHRGNRHFVCEQATQYSDTSSVHSPCDPCYSTWRTKSPDEAYPCEGDLIKEYNDLCRELSELQNNMEAINDGAEDEDDDMFPRGRCEHVSRSDRRRGRREKRTGGKQCQASEKDFESSLKKPHPNSCERCWRYASPSRSPVNKPSQRFDPNYRKSHSDVCVNPDGKENESHSLENHESKKNHSWDERETKVHQLMSPGSRLASPVGRSSRSSASPTGGIKSSEDFKRSRGDLEKDAGGGSGSRGGRSNDGSRGSRGSPGTGEGYGTGLVRGSSKSRGIGEGYGAEVRRRTGEGYGTEFGRVSRGASGTGEGFGKGMVRGPSGGYDIVGGRSTGQGYDSGVGRGFVGARGTTGSRGTSGRTQSDTANLKKSQPRGDGRSFSVNFEIKSQKKREPVLASSKLEQKYPKSVKKPIAGSRPSTSATGSATKLGKGAKSKTAVASQTSTSQVKSSQKTRPNSFDRGERPVCEEKIVRGTSSCLKRSPAKPPQTASAHHRPECTFKQKMSCDSAVGGHRSRPDSSRSCLCRNLSRQDGGVRSCPIHSSDNSPKPENTSSPRRCCNYSPYRSNSPIRSCRGEHLRRPAPETTNGPTGEIPFADGGRSAFRNVQHDRKKLECLNHGQGRSRCGRREAPEGQKNPRKYCVFYMNKTKPNRADDVEILIEELTQGKRSKDSSDESLKEKMKRIRDVRGDSMALRFQKGVSQHCQRPESNRVLYF